MTGTLRGILEWAGIQPGQCPEAQGPFSLKLVGVYGQSDKRAAKIRVTSNRGAHTVSLHLPNDGGRLVVRGTDTQATMLWLKGLIEEHRPQAVVRALVDALESDASTAEGLALLLWREGLVPSQWVSLGGPLQGPVRQHACKPDSLMVTPGGLYGYALCVGDGLEWYRQVQRVGEHTVGQALALIRPEATQTGARGSGVVLIQGPLTAQRLESVRAGLGLCV